MIRATLLAAAALFAFSAGAQEAAVDWRRCLVAKSRIEVVWEGERYPLRDEACRAAFLTDPERFAQLLDALRELGAAGSEAPARSSLVPS